MAYPQGFIFQPSVSLALQCPTFGSGVVLGPRTEELGRSSSGSAFAPYSGSVTSPGFNSHLPFGGEPRAAGTLNSFVSPGYDPSSGLSGSLEYHPFGPLGPYPYGDPTYRKNATRDATATLKAWLNEHRKNPYPTKGEKIMLAIITKMTLTQVSTWFANARRRLKKENKMTWTPRNRSEDEEEEDIDLERNEEEEPMKMNADETENVTRRALDSCVLAFRDDSDVDRGFSDLDSGDQRQAHQPGPTPVSGAPPQNQALNLLRVSESSLSPPPKEHVDSCGATQGPNSGPKPKLWSLAEIATSDKSKGGIDFSQSGLAVQNPFSHGTTLTRHLYYTSPFIPGYSSFGPLGPLHGAGSHLNGLQQKILQRAEAAARDCRFPNQNQNQNQLELHKVKRGMTNV